MAYLLVFLVLQSLQVDVLQLEVVFTLGLGSSGEKHTHLCGKQKREFCYTGTVAILDDM